MTNSLLDSLGDRAQRRGGLERDKPSGVVWLEDVFPPPPGGRDPETVILTCVYPGNGQEQKASYRPEGTSVGIFRKGAPGDDGEGTGGARPQRQ